MAEGRMCGARCRAARCGDTPPQSRSHGARGLWLTGFEELFFAIDHGIDVVGGELESMTMRDRVSGAGFDAISAKNATRIIDIVDGGVAFGGGDAIGFGIFGGL